MFSYKDIRMLVFSIVLEFACLVTAIYFMNDKIKMIIALFLAISLIPTLLIHFHAKIFDDSMIVYVFKGIAIIPEIIAFQDIKEVTQLSKHRITIIHKKTSHLWIVDASAFMNDYQQHFHQFQQKNTQS